MKLSARTATMLAAGVVFIGLPLAFYTLGDAPRRTFLKEVISVTTLLAFTAMLGQFFMARSNTWLLSVFKPPQIQRVHKYIAYSAVAVILAHPGLIVLPRFFEGGVTPWDALVTMVTTFDNIALLMGFFAYLILVVLVITAFFRKPIIRRLPMHYRGWRYAHGGVAVTFTALALWHSIVLGRHTDVVMSAFFLLLAAIGFAMLAQLYRDAATKRPEPTSKGVRS